MKNKSKRVMLILSGGLIAAVIVLLLLFMFHADESVKKEKEEDSNTPEIMEEVEGLDENQKRVQEYAKLFNDYLIDPTKSTKDYEKLTGIQNNYFDPMVGIDSDSQYNVTDEYPEQVTEDISRYKAKQTEYANRLANTIKENYSLKLKGDPLYTADKKQLMQVVEVVPFSYSLYQLDTGEVVSQLLDLANIKNRDDIKAITQIYKAKVKAMEILDSQLDTYKNEKKFETNMIYDIGKTITCNNCHLYINYAEGVYLESVMPPENYEKSKDKRINEIINEAVKNGILDKKNPLKLK